MFVWGEKTERQKKGDENKIEVLFLSMRNPTVEEEAFGDLEIRSVDEGGE